MERLSNHIPPLTSISAVELSPDFRHAKAFVRIVPLGLDKTERTRLLDEVEETLSFYRKDMQRQIHRRISMKFCPVLSFRVGFGEELQIQPEGDPGE